MTHTSDATEAERDPDRLTVQELRDLHQQLVQEHQEYRSRVRDRAIQGFRERHWDLTALNDTLTGLDLPQFDPVYVTDATLIVEMRVTADGDLDTATRTMRAALGTTEVRQAIHQAITHVLADQQITDVSVKDDCALRLCPGYQTLT